LQLPLFDDAGTAHGKASPITRAALYDAVYEGRRADLSVYLGLCTASRGRVLELGAGTGRLLAPLLAKGIDALGIERDPDALEVGRRRLGALGGQRFSHRLVEGDMTSFALPSRFSLVIIACNTVSLLLEEADLAAALGAIRRHLLPGGALVFDVSRVEGHSWHRPPYTWQSEAEGVWVAGVAASTVESGSYDPVTRRCRVTRDFQLADGRSARAQTESHQRSVEHLLTSVRAAGFEPSVPIDESGCPLGEASTLAFVRSQLAS
jgi:SAM-dependent methyltransferase